MSEDERFETWLEKVCQRPMPTLTNQIARIETYARELAEGVDKGFWDHNIYMQEIPADAYYPEKAEEISQTEYEAGGMITVIVPESPLIKKYIARKWDKNEPRFSLLEIHDYAKAKEAKVIVDETPYREPKFWQLTKSAFMLLQRSLISTVFISYRRMDSSVFALLVYEKLRANEISVFLDKDLRAGDNWQSNIEENIKQANSFILLIGKNTLSSKVVLNEITWAMEAGLTIIPVWHGGFEYQSGDWGNIPVNIDRLLQNTHAIRVREESALDYNTAIVELLNRFGVTP